jgi:hypothetical protein
MACVGAEVKGQKPEVRIQNRTKKQKTFKVLILKPGHSFYLSWLLASEFWIQKH